MNKFVVVALIVSAIAAVAAYRYYGPVSTGCACALCPCEQVATEEVVVIETPAEVIAEEVVEKDAQEETHTNCCCGQVCADQKHDDVK